jgi:hypothetical protein
MARAAPLFRGTQHHRPPLAEKPEGCTILDCGRPVAALGMCWGHYRRQLDGSPVYVYLRQRPGAKRVSVVSFGPPRPSYRVRRIERIKLDLAENVTWEPNTGCALWLGAFHNQSGYGLVGNGRDLWGRYAHRAVLYFAGVNLAPTNAMHVRHTCDQPACINPRHLVYGTALENMRDRDRKGRNGNVVVSRDTVRAIVLALRDGDRPSDIAKRLGVPSNLVSRIKTGKSWRWFSDEIRAATLHQQNAA